MQQLKYYIEFRENPQIGDVFSYVLRDNFGVIAYENTETLMVMQFGSGNIMPNQTAVLSSLDLTLNNLLTQLNMGWEINTSSTQLTYARVGNAIEITINHSNGLNLQNVLMGSRFFMRTARPCQTFVLQTNRPVYGASSFLTNEEITTIFSLTPTSVTDLTLNLSLPIENHVFNRGNLIRINYSEFPNIFFCRAFAGQTFEPFFTQNTLFIPVFIDQTTPNNAFQFSLNGTDWQDVNQFENLDEGVYNVSIRDLFGCVRTYEIENTGQSNIPSIEPNIYISESNSIRFVKNETGLRNIYNTASFQETEINDFCHNFKSDETIQTEIRSSYQDLESTHGTIDKIVSNIGITDSRDALFFNQNGNLVCSFSSGNIYVDDIEVGTFDLNGNLPEWGVINNWCSTSFGLFQIIDVQVLENGIKYLVFNSNEVVSEPTESIITCTYNRENYDIFILTIPMTELVDSCFQVSIFNDEQFFYTSERICVNENLPSSFRLFTWRNSKNTDVFFASGIEMRAWLPITRLNELSDGEVEILKTDSRVFTIQNLDYKAVQLVIDNLPSGIARQMKLALKHDILSINNIFYKLAEAPELENYSGSFFYRISAKLLEQGDTFNSLGNTSPFTGDVLRLLETGLDNYIRL